MKGEEQDSLPELVARFSLRARARRGDYLSGQRLADADAVTVQAIEAHRAVLTVVDGGHRFDVQVTVSNKELIAACDCAGISPVCRHAVAAEHALWRRLVS